MMDSSFDPDFAGPPDYALLYRKLGLQVVPCKSPTEATVWKRPALSSWKDLENQLADDGVFAGWYSPGGQHHSRTNMGLITGAASNRVFVVDVDEQRHDSASQWLASVRYDCGVSKFDTPTQRTGGGGLQLLFRAPDDWTAPTCKTPIGIDIRGQGGFAVLAPSLHDSGRHYEWLPGFEPWNMEIMDAPAELMFEIDQLQKQYGAAGSQVSATVQHTLTPAHSMDPFGQRIDGREDYMTRLVWGRVVDLYRECPILPGNDELQAAMRSAFQVYERSTKSRLFEPGVPNHVLLEREGRGMSLFQQKWAAAIRQWDGKVAQQAAHLPAGRQTGGGAPAGRVDPETGEIIEDEFVAPQDLYELLDVNQIKDLPDPKWLVEGLVIEQGLGFIYGPPGCGKSFIALDLAFHIASGRKEWWGRPIQHFGPVIYISSEGVSDIKHRIAAWEMANMVALDDHPFYLIRQSIDLMQPQDHDKLLRTIKSVSDKHKINAVAVFVDTVSRTLPGADENLQADASMWVKATDAVREHFGSSVIGLHHTNRQASNMRGSTVFDGAADFMLEVIREQGQEIGNIRAAKIKAAADGWTEAFQLIKQATGDLKGTVSLVAKPAVISATPKSDWPAIAICNSILTALEAAWAAGKPWSPYARSSSEGRYAVTHMLRWGIGEEMALKMIESWQMDAVIGMETYDKKSKLKGLKLLKPVQQEEQLRWPH